LVEESIQRNLHVSDQNWPCVSYCWNENCGVVMMLGVCVLLVIHHTGKCSAAPCWLAGVEKTFYSDGVCCCDSRMYCIIVVRPWEKTSPGACDKQGSQASAMETLDRWVRAPYRASRSTNCKRITSYLDSIHDDSKCYCRKLVHCYTPRSISLCRGTYTSRN
jgi:hypothetical protein